MKFFLSILTWSLITLTGTLAVSPYKVAHYLGRNEYASTEVNFKTIMNYIKSSAAAAKPGLFYLPTLWLHGQWVTFNTEAFFIQTRTEASSYILKSNLTGKARASLGNIPLGIDIGFHFEYPEGKGSWDFDRWNFIFVLSSDFYFPSSRYTEGSAIAQLWPTIYFFPFLRKGKSLVPTFTFTASRSIFTLKSNLSYGYSWVTPSTLKTWVAQMALTGHFHLNGQFNLEWNTIYLDSSFPPDETRFRHTLSPSISVRSENTTGSLFTSLSLDAPSRKQASIAFGFNIGHSF